MKRQLISIFSILVLTCQLGFAQDTLGQSADSVKKEVPVSQAVRDAEYGVVEEVETAISEVDTIIYPLLSSVAFLFDYGKLIGLVLDTESKYEVGLQFDIKNKIVLVGEYGIARLEPTGAYQNAEYVSEGSYFRLGLGYKIDMNPKNNIVLSARYGMSTTDDKGTITINSTSGLYDNIVEPFNRSGISASWYELALSSEVRMWKGLYLGFHFRLRIMDKYDKQTPLDVYSIPGYGRTFDKTIPALNLYVKYAFERF